MATTKKTTAKTAAKTETKKEPIIKEVEVTPVKKAEKKVDIVKKEYAPDELIDCISIMPGFVCMTGAKSNMNYYWQMTGDVVGVEYQDLIILANQRSPYLTKPFIAIQDMDIVNKYPYLKEIYENLYDVSEIKEVILKLKADDLKATIDAMPAGVKEAVKTVTATMIDTGELDSLSKIKAIDEVFGTKLALAIEFRN